MQEQMSQISEFNKSLVASFQKAANIHGSLAMNLAQQQMDALNICVEGGMKQVQTLSEVKRPQDLLSAQPSLVEDINKKLLNNARVSLEMMVESKNELAQLAEENMKAFSEYKPLLKAVKA